MCSSIGFVDKLGFVSLIQMLAVFVLILYAIPLMLPGVLSESWVVLETVHEEIASGNGIVDGEASGVSNGIGVRREFSALEEEGTGIGVFLKGLLAKGNHTRLDLGGVNLLSKSNGFESGNILTSVNLVSVLVDFDTTLILDEVVHGLESSRISSHDDDLLVMSESAGDSGELAESTHENGEVSGLSGEGLSPHHETTVTGDTLDLLCVSEPQDSFDELFLDIFIHVVVLADGESVTRDDTEENIVGVRFGGINVTRSSGVVVVKSYDTETYSFSSVSNLVL